MKIYKMQHRSITLIIFLVTTLIAFTVQATEITKRQFQAYPLALIDTPSYSNDLWKRMRSGFALQGHYSKEVLNSKEVRKEIASYTRNPKDFYRITERSERYLYYIVEEVESRGMPAEIALLPIVESAFNPEAKSSSNAVGLWQFIPSTGKSFGLTQNGWLDERMDVIAATSAALDYLQALYETFDDWKLAFSAYNWGQGAVRDSLAKNREEGLPENFHNIKLPSETRKHVHKLIALKKIIANPASYGIELNAIPNQPYFDTVKANHHMDIELVAKLADISVDEFNALNPAYKQEIIRVNGSPRILLLPVDKVEIFSSNLANYEEPLMLWRMHQVKKGEDVKKISQRHSISVAQLRRANGITGNAKISHGQTLLVPRIERNKSADTTIVRKKPI